MNRRQRRAGGFPAPRKITEQEWEWIRHHAQALWESLGLECTGETVAIRVAVLTAVVHGFCQAKGVPLPRCKFELTPPPDAEAEGGGT